MSALMTIKELCALSRLSRSTIHGLVKSGQLPSLKIGSCVRFHPDDVEAFLATMRQSDWKAL